MNKLLVLVVLASIACGGDDDGRTTPTPGVDSGTPTPGVDSGTPMPGVDSGTPMPGVDSGTPMPGVDSGTPMTGDRDPRLQTNPAAGQVSCGTMTCNVPSQTCCTTLFPQGQTCQAAGSCSGGTSAPGNCDGPEDCMGGQLCCAPSGFADLTSGTTCEASCGSRFQMCQTNADCPGGQTCHTCTPPMGMGGVVGLCNAGASCPGSYMTL
ncbi:MAG: hypothetical protein H6721_15595 [Sandaracinus sp.]|nr:hypothetical protein [Sandaracinus sp.]MCB9633540.1 hypothetical protein [Sandaracinus sp.]